MSRTVRVDNGMMGEEQGLWERGGNASPLSGTGVTDLGTLCTASVPEVLKED